MMWPEDEYLTALGRAIYAVSYLEWVIIEVINRVDSTEELSALAGLTTGQIADRLRRVAASSKLSGDSATDLRGAADEVARIPKARNDVVHARPATDNGRQRLYRWAPGVAKPRFIGIDDLNQLAAHAVETIRLLNAVRGQLT